MDDDSKQILLLKLGVGFLVFLAIMIVFIIIMSIKNANKKQEGLETTTRRTLSGEVIEDVTSTSWFTEETTTSSETTTTTTTPSTTTVQPTRVAPETTRRTTARTTTTRKPSGGGSSGGGGGQSEIPQASYTVIGPNDSTSYHNADNSMEWNLYNKLNSYAGNKYKMALELRTAAERIAEVCCQAPGSCKESTGRFVNEEIQLTFKVYYDYSRDINSLYKNLISDTLKSGNYNYIGVGTVKAGSSSMCGAWVVDE